MSKQYITTAIDYPNAPPHMGHVLEKVLADVCARWFRLRGDEVRFQIGTDEHGIKIQRTAEKEGITPQELVDRNVPLFQDLYKRLYVSADNFVRTTDRTNHWPTVQSLWRKLRDAGKLEKRSYTGLYCSGCERFVTPKDLIDGKCPDHKVAPEEVTEENWFFTLRKDTAWLKELLTKREYAIIPEFRANETLSLLEQGLEDVSFSRPVSSLAWGVPVPDEDNQTMYVWCDALTNYISTLGLLTDNHGATWWNDATVTHVIGKDIARFHALIWPAMLKHADLKTPDQLLIHGFLTSEGEKMSKSTGNVVVPQDVIEKYGVDPLRFYLSQEVAVGNDGDFSWERFGNLYDSALRNKLGNLLNRILVLLQKADGNFSGSLVDTANVKELVEKNWTIYMENMNTFEVNVGVSAAMNILDQSNSMITVAEPWKKPVEESREILSSFAEGLRHVALMLLPIMPETAQKISRQLNVPYAEEMLNNDFVITEEMKEWGSQKDWKSVGTPEILFAPVE